MNQIKLTDRQSKRLIKMCMNLFVSDIKPHIDNNNNIVVWNLAKEVNAEYATSIHWFEFCMTKLWIKINSLLSHKTPEELMSMYNAFWDILNEELHPVDYLYGQFKQLKINK